MLERLYIKEAAKQLGFKDVRSFKRWCMNNSVTIFSYTGSNKQYVADEEFEAALLNIPCLIKRYGLPAKEEGHSLKKSTLRKNFKSNYQPKGHHEISFLKRLTLKFPEL